MIGCKEKNTFHQCWKLKFGSTCAFGLVTDLKVLLPGVIIFICPERCLLSPQKSLQWYTVIMPLLVSHNHECPALVLFPVELSCSGPLTRHFLRNTGQFYCLSLFILFTFYTLWKFCTSNEIISIVLTKKMFEWTAGTTKFMYIPRIKKFWSSELASTFFSFNEE